MGCVLFRLKILTEALLYAGCSRYESLVGKKVSQNTKSIGTLFLFVSGLLDLHLSLSSRGRASKGGCGIVASMK